MGLTDITGVVVYQCIRLLLRSASHGSQGHFNPRSNNCSCLVQHDRPLEIIMSKTWRQLQAIYPQLSGVSAIFCEPPTSCSFKKSRTIQGPPTTAPVDANGTLTKLVNPIAAISNITYQFASVNPVDGQDEGQPGGNIRTAFLYNPQKLTLVGSAPAGGPLDPIKVTAGFLKPQLSFNSGRIDPLNLAFDSSREPLIAHWEFKKGQELFTINVHLSSEGGSSSTQGDARPPVNSLIDVRTARVASVAGFVKSLLAKNPLANIIVAGDFNEYLQTRSVYAPISSLLTDIDEIAKIREVERYSYVFDHNPQQLDHVLVSKAIRHRKVKFEHIHVKSTSTTGPPLSALVPVTMTLLWERSVSVDRTGYYTGRIQDSSKYEP